MESDNTENTSFLPNFTRKSEYYEKLSNDMWNDSEQVKKLNEIQKEIYFRVYFSRWKKRNTDEFINRLRKKVGARQSGKEEINRINDLDTIKLLERARRTVDKLVSISSNTDNYSDIIESQSQTGSYYTGESYSGFFTNHSSYIQSGKSAIVREREDQAAIIFPKEEKVKLHRGRLHKYPFSLADSFTFTDCDSSFDEGIKKEKHYADDLDDMSEYNFSHPTDDQ